MIVYVALSFFLYLSAIPASALTQWHRTALGRTVHVFNHSRTSEILLLTSLSAVACIDAGTSDVIWRIPPPISAEPVMPLQAVSLRAPHPPFLLVLLSDHTLRAIDADTHSVVWHIAVCQMGQPQRDAIPVLTCDGRVLWAQLATGTLYSAPVTTSSGPATTNTDHGISTNNVNAFTPLPLLQSDTPHSLRWSLGSHLLTSATDGSLCLYHDSRQLWCREDGIAHVSSGAIYTTTPSTTVVVLSHLFSLYALNDGSILWKVPVGRHCILLNDLPDIAVVVCKPHNDDHSTLVLAVRVSDGVITFTKTVSNFQAVRASVDQCCGTAICVVAVDETGREEWIAQCDPTPFRSNLGAERGWLLYHKGGNRLRGVRGGATIWSVSMPTRSSIASVITSRPLHPASSRIRNAPVRVTGNRNLLRKFVDENVILVLAEDRKSAQIHAMVLDSSTGTLYNAVTHPKAHAPVAGVRGDNWFVYTFWNAIIMHQEVHIIDMYHRPMNTSWVGGTLRLAVRTLFGPDIMNAFGIPDPDSMSLCDVQDRGVADPQQCSNEPGTEGNATRSFAKPVIYRSGMLMTRRVTGLDITETIMGVTESSVIMTLEGGQVSLVSKFTLDARRPDVSGSDHYAELLAPYSPVLTLESHAKQSAYVAEGVHVPTLTHVAVAPCLDRESTTQVAMLGMDVVFSLLQPAGSFDTLPEDFVYPAVIVMILALVFGVIYSHKLKLSSSLSRSW